MNKVGSYLKNIFSNIWKNEFNRNVLILVSGTTIAQVIPILITPLLTRLYTPADFGVLALFISVVSIISVIACGRYELAIMLPEKDEDALNLIVVALLINIFVSLAFFFFILLYGDWFLKLIKAEVLKSWIYFAPLMVFWNGIFNILNYANSRFKLYKDIAKARVYKSISMAIVQLILGFLKSGHSGLITGHLVAQFIANLKLCKNIQRQEPAKVVKKERIKLLAKRYLKFPLLSTWASLMNSLGYQLLSILIGVFFGPTILGYFYLAYRTLDMPVSLVSSSIAQVFYQEASTERARTGSIANTFRRTFKKLTIASLSIFIPVLFLVKPIFVILFGDKWKEAGMYAMILTPMFAIRFVSYVFTLTPFVLEKQHVDVFFQFGVFLVILSSFLFNHSEPTTFLTGLSLLLMVYYGGYIYVNYRLSRGDKE